MEVALNSAVKYLLNNIHYFDVPNSGGASKEIKPFVELVFLYNMLPSSSRNNEQWRAIETYIFTQIETNNFAENLDCNIDAISGVAVLEEFLLIHGKSTYRDMLLRMIDEKKDVSVKRLPFRHIDAKYSLQQAKIQNNLPRYEELYAETILGKGGSRYYLTPAAMYSITHTVFYLTGMGRNDKYLKLLEHKTELLQSLLTENIMRNDLDLLGEVVMSCLFIGVETDEVIRPLLTYAMNVMKKQQLPSRAFPAPIKPKQDLDEKATFRLQYHTTLVCIGALTWYLEKM